MFAFAAAGLILLSSMGASTHPPTESALPASREPIDFESGQRAGGAEIFRAIQLHYPEEYRALTETLNRRPPNPGAEDARPALRSRLLAAFYRRRADGLANAPAHLLNSINASQLTLIRLLARDDAALCAEFATTLLIGRFDLPAFYQGRANALSIAILEAAKAGEALPPNPRRKGLPGDDAALWYEQLLLVEPSSEIQAAIALDGAETSGTPEMQCRVGAATYGAIEKLPPESAANVGASFLAQILADAGSD